MTYLCSLLSIVSKKELISKFTSLMSGVFSQSFPETSLLKDLCALFSENCQVAVAVILLKKTLIWFDKSSLGTRSAKR